MAGVFIILLIFLVCGGFVFLLRSWFKSTSEKIKTTSNKDEAEEEDAPAATVWRRLSQSASALSTSSSPWIAAKETLSYFRRLSQNVAAQHKYSKEAATQTNSVYVLPWSSTSGGGYNQITTSTAANAKYAPYMTKVSSSGPADLKSPCPVATSSYLAPSLCSSTYSSSSTLQSAAFDFTPNSLASLAPFASQNTSQDTSQNTTQNTQSSPQHDGVIWRGSFVPLSTHGTNV